jgi:hypothetical protein
MARVVECLPNNLETLNSNLSIAKNFSKVKAGLYINTQINIIFKLLAFYVYT